MRRHPRRAPVNPRRPRAWGTSDRNGMVGQHDRMRFQHEWAGMSIVNTGILVHPDELDRPQRQLGSNILPPDPMPIRNARPENYYIDELYAQVATTYTIPSPGYIVDADGTATFTIALPTTADANGESVTVNNNGEFSVTLQAVALQEIINLNAKTSASTYLLAAETSVTLLIAGGDWQTWTLVAP